METTTSLIERLRDQTKTRSDYAVAKLMGVTPQAVSRWKKGDSTMDVTNGVKAAELLEMDPMQVIAWLELERGPLPKHTDMWQRYSGRLLPSIILASIIGFGGVSEGMDAFNNIANSILHTSDYAHLQAMVDAKYILCA